MALISGDFFQPHLSEGNLLHSPFGTVPMRNILIDSNKLGHNLPKLTCSGVTYTYLWAACPAGDEAMTGLGQP